jgi:hypothetical protein
VNLFTDPIKRTALGGADVLESVFLFKYYFGFGDDIRPIAGIMLGYTLVSPPLIRRTYLQMTAF